MRLSPKAIVQTLLQDMERKGLPLPERVKLRAALKLASPYSHLVHENDILQNWTSEERVSYVSGVLHQEYQYVRTRLFEQKGNWFSPK